MRASLIAGAGVPAALGSDCTPARRPALPGAGSRAWIEQSVAQIDSLTRRAWAPDTVGGVVVGIQIGDSLVHTIALGTAVSTIVCRRSIIKGVPTRCQMAACTRLSPTLRASWPSR